MMTMTTKTKTTMPSSSSGSAPVAPDSTSPVPAAATASSSLSNWYLFKCKHQPLSHRRCPSECDLNYLHTHFQWPSCKVPSPLRVLARITLTLTPIVRVSLFLGHYAARLPIGIKITKHPIQLPHHSYHL